MRLVVLFFCLVAIVSCKKKETESKPDLGYAYFPISVGDWRVYQVDSTYYDGFTGDTLYFSYQIKESIIDTFTDLSAQKSFILKRYKRKTTSEPWLEKDTWMIRRLPTRGEQIEENQRIVKLIFPIDFLGTWDGNAFNNQDSLAFTYSEVHVMKTILGQSFDSTLTVTQFSNENILEKQSFTESYAKNIGMVYKESIDVDFQESQGYQTIFQIIDYKIN